MTIHLVQNDWGLAIKGPINFSTVVALRKLGDQMIKNFPGDCLRVDFAEVARVNSTALALMLEWMRLAKTLGKTIKFNHVPPALLKIAEVCGVLPFLSLEELS